MKDFIGTDVFKKLNQLDRIEYMLGLKNIRKKYEAGYFLAVLNSFFVILGFLLLLGVTGYSAFGIDFLTSINVIIMSVIKIAGVLMGILLIIDILVMIKGNIESTKFNKEFFKIEVKKK